MCVGGGGGGGVYMRAGGRVGWSVGGAGWAAGGGGGGCGAIGALWLGVLVGREGGAVGRWKIKLFNDKFYI